MRRHGGRPPPGTLDFSSPLNPLGPPAWLWEAIEGALPELARYPDYEYAELRASLARLLGVGDPALIVPLNGAAEGLPLVLSALRPRRLVVVEPTFGDNALTARALGVEYAAYKLSPGDEGWTLDPSGVCLQPPEALRGILVLMSNPNNPTGLHLPPQAVEALAGCLLERGAWLVVDEAFVRLSQRPHWSVAGRAPPNVIVLGSLTKDLALPGLRLGYLVAHDRGVAGLLEAARQPWNVNPLAARVGVELAGRRADFESHLAAARELIASEAPRMLAALRSLGVEAWWGGPPYILLHHPSRPHPGLARALHAMGVHVRDASSFHGLGPGYSRVSIRMPGENSLLLEALARALAG